MSMNRIEITNDALPNGLPARIWALQFVKLVLQHSPPSDPDKLAWMHVGVELSARVAANLEFILEGNIRAGKETTFALLNVATGKANLDVPTDHWEQVVCRDTGAALGSYRDVVDLGRWIVGVAQYANESLSKPRRKQRRATAAIARKAA
jgi:hypothetical protein